MRPLTLLLLCTSLLPTWLSAADAPPPRSISVSGRGVVETAPDEVSLHLGVESRDRELAKAKAAADKAWKALRKAIQAQGIKPEQQRDSQVSVQPEFDYDNGRQTLRGYLVRRSLQVTLKDLDRYEALLTSSLESGANFLNQGEWKSSKLEAHKAQARKLAVQAAREKAAAMAAELGQKLGRPLSIEEQGQDYAPPRPYAQANMMKMANDGGGEAAPSSPGSIEISASVGVVFELE